MATSKVAAAITYEKPGTQPPMYVAGTFSEPPWEAYEMDYDTDAHGEHAFSKKVEGEPGSKIQYKFRVGPGDWWVLHEGMPTVTDIHGNTNHELELPHPEQRASEQAASEEQTPDHQAPEDQAPEQQIPEKEAPEQQATEKDAPEQQHAEEEAPKKNVPEKQADPREQSHRPSLDISFANFSRLPNPFSAPNKRDKNGDAVEADTISPKTTMFDANLTSQADSKPQVSPTPTHARIAVLAAEAAAVAAEVADSAALVNTERPETPVPDDLAGKIGYRRMSSTPILEVANTAAEVADSARELDKAEPVIEFEIRPDSATARRGQIDDFLGFDAEITEQSPPLFAHECIGMYDDQEDVHEDVAGRDIRHDAEIRDQSEMNPDTIDLNDPTLEHFPSDRDEIIDTVRKLETGLDEDQPLFEGAPLSPVFPTARRGSEDPVGDLLLSPVPVSPIIPRINKRLDLSRSPRLGASSNHPSMASLHSISEAEEPTPGEETRASPVVLLSTPLSRSPFDPPGSDEDEGVSLKDNETTKKKTENGDILSAGYPLQENSSKSSSETEEAEGLPVAPSTKGAAQATMEASKTPEPTPREGPRIVIEAPESAEASVEEGTSTSDGYQAKTVDGDGIAGKGANDQAATTSTDIGSGTPNGGSAQLRKRDGPRIERSGTPVSAHAAAIPVAKEGGWFKAFFRLLFVDWIGGFISKLCGNRRHT